MKFKLSFLIPFLVFGCTLDDFMFNQSKLDHYDFDDYTGEVDFRLDSSYFIPDSLIHLFFLPSGEDQSLIACTYIGNLDEISTDTVILYCHGNKDHMDFYWPRAKLLANLRSDQNRYGLLYFDYFGYGMSAGTPSENGLNENTESALNWLKSQGLTQDRLVIYGFSLGSYPSIYQASYSEVMKPNKLILEAPIGTSQAIIDQSTVLSHPGGFFMEADFNNIHNMKAFTGDLLLFHGGEDKFLPFKIHGQSLYNAHDVGFKQLKLIPNADHGDLPKMMGFELYLEEIRNFIQR